ncbi:MAG: hypothetical protein O7G85_06285, partial [Planctomycetota bacterium]|nr:hypothetical protein [Planctomycetota bacterium]
TSIDEVQIDAHITCGGSSAAEARERLEGTLLKIERDTSGMLSVYPVFPGASRNNDGARISIRLPDAYGAELTTGNGRVVAKGLSGTLIIDTSNGRIIVNNHQGDAKLDTSNGSVEVRDHSGPLEVHTSNGKVTVTLLPDCVGPIHLRSSNGRLRAEVGSSFAGRVDFDTSNGRVTVTGGDDVITRERLHRTSGYVIFGDDDGPRSVMDTSNGSIEFIVKD